jgi:hypothetical protein
MTRRGWLLAVLGPGVLVRTLRADDSTDVWDLLTEVAEALSEGNLDEFFAAFDRAMPDYQTLMTNVSGLVREYEVGSTIEPLSEEGDGRMRTLDLDWFLELVEQQDNTNLTRRRERVHVRVVKTGKKWKITSLEPIAFFAPPVENK